MKRLVALAAAAVLAGCAMEAPPEAPSEERGSATDSGAGRRAGLVRAENVPVEITVDTGERDLGAYTVQLVYDAGLVRVAAVESTLDFAPPQYSRRGFNSGELTLVAYQLDPGPRGRIPIARVRFESLSGESSRLSVRLVTLVDGEARPIKGRAEASREKVP